MHTATERLPANTKKLFCAQVRSQQVLSNILLLTFFKCLQTLVKTINSAIPSIKMVNENSSRFNLGLISRLIAYDSLISDEMVTLVIKNLDLYPYYS